MTLPNFLVVRSHLDGRVLAFSRRRSRTSLTVSKKGTDKLVLKVLTDSQVTTMVQKEKKTRGKP